MNIFIHQKEGFDANGSSVTSYFVTVQTTINETYEFLTLNDAIGFIEAAIKQVFHSCDFSNS